MMSNQIGYIKINDLISQEIVAQFDTALEHMKESRGLILDLRDIPRGGNTDVAEPILSRFVEQKMGYQLVVPLREAAYVKPVAPAGTWTYKKPIVVLVNRWTGSMGEGMAIGLDAMKRATIVGTRMAGLNGGIFNMQLPNTKIGITYPGERLNHLNGTPREDFVPPLLVNLLDIGMERYKDPIFELGHRRLKGMLELRP
jgi:carboxyl-terminal processing protease